jgi:four helix bundle protein
MENELSTRLFNFAISVIKFLNALPSTPETHVIRHRLTKSSTSSGANYEEAQASSSRADFSNKARIALREMRESSYWLNSVILRI